MCLTRGTGKESAVARLQRSGVWISFGYYNKIDLKKWGVYTTVLFLTALQAGSLRSEGQHGQILCLACRQLPSCHGLTWPLLGACAWRFYIYIPLLLFPSLCLFFLTTLLWYKLHTKMLCLYILNVYSSMNLEESVTAWNHHHNLCHEYIRHLQKFPPTLSTYHWFIILCVFDKNTSKIVKLLELESRIIVAKCRGREKWGGICQCSKLQLCKMRKS